MGGNKSNRKLPEPDLIPGQRSDIKQFLGGSETVPANLREEHAPHARFAAAKMLGNYLGLDKDDYIVIIETLVLALTCFLCPLIY